MACGAKPDEARLEADEADEAAPDEAEPAALDAELARELAPEVMLAMADELPEAEAMADEALALIDERRLERDDEMEAVALAAALETELNRELMPEAELIPLERMLPEALARALLMALPAAEV